MNFMCGWSGTNAHVRSLKPSREHQEAPAFCPAAFCSFPYPASGVSFTFILYLLALLGAAATTRLAFPLWRNLCLRRGWVDDPGERKIHEQPVPLAGGLAVMTGLVLPAFAAACFLWLEDVLGRIRPAVAGFHTQIDSQSVGSLLLYGLNKRASELGGIFLGALGMLSVGWLDDQRELRPGLKFAGQFLVALLVAASGARITLFVPYAPCHYALTILWILTVVNAFNFMDNMNGLCAGLGAIGAWYFAMIAAAEGQYLVAIIAFLTFGALLGFLPCNFPRARGFLGDSGSHLVGYLLAVLAILPHFYTASRPHRWAVSIPLLVLAVPLADLVWVVILRWRLGQPFYVGDNNHLSHRLVRRGFSPVLAVAAIWLLAALAGSLALWL